MPYFMRDRVGDRHARRLLAWLSGVARLYPQCPEVHGYEDFFRSVSVGTPVTITSG